MNVDGFDFARLRPGAPASRAGSDPAGGPRRTDNQLFTSLPEPDWQRWREKLEPVHMPAGMVRQEPDQPRSHVWFPSTAIVSLLSTLSDGTASQIAVVGNEGLVGVAVVLGAEVHPSRAVVHAAGHGFRMEAADLQAEFGEVAALQMLLRYALTLITQIAQGAVCNRHHLLEQQLARWLLAQLERQPGRDIRITHEQLANLLGFRREGVTVALARLQEAGGRGQGALSTLAAAFACSKGGRLRRAAANATGWCSASTGA